jgi:hypothetical protein
LPGWQVPVASQYPVAAQSGSVAQVVGQVVLAPSHTKGEHDGLPGEWRSAGPHVPFDGAPFDAAHAPHPPLHAELQQKLSTQKALAHVVAPPGHDWPLLSLHAPVASQVLFPEQVSGSSALVTVAQSPVPALQ